MDIIEINNLYYKYDDNVIFNNVNLNIKEFSFTTIVGKKGKSTLTKILNNKLDFIGEITISNLELCKRNKKDLNNIIGVIDDIFLCETVLEEITYQIKNTRYKEIEKKLVNIKKIVNIDNIINKRIDELSFSEKQIVGFLKVIIKNPKIIVIDDSLSMVDNYIKKRIFRYLKKMISEKKLTVVYFTNNTEDLLYSDYLIVLDEGKVLFNSSLKDVLSHEKELNIDIPYVCRLSNKIKYYGLVNKTYYDFRKLVDDLWK